MLPVIANIPVVLPTQPTLVATPMPNAAAVRAPYDAVAPSVSNPAVGDNKQGNASVASAAQVAVSAAVSADVPLSVPIPASFSTNSASLSAGAMYATQDMAQNSDDAPVFLQAYEKMVALSEVKFKPSNAGVPEAQPADVFSRVMQQDRAAPRPAPIAHAVETQVASSEVAAHSAPAPVRTPGKPRAEAPSADVSLQTLGAYRAANSRNQSLSHEPVEAVDSVPAQ